MLNKYSLRLVLQYGAPVLALLGLVAINSNDEPHATDFYPQFEGDLSDSFDRPKDLTSKYDPTARQSDELLCGVNAQGDVTVVARGVYAIEFSNASFEPFEQPDEMGRIGICAVTLEGEDALGANGQEIEMFAVPKHLALAPI